MTTHLKRRCDRCGRPAHPHCWFAVMRGYCLTRMLGQPCSTLKETP